MPTEGDAEKKPTDGEILFPEVKVCGYTVRPWTFGDTAALGPEFRGMIRAIREEKVGFDDIEERFPEIVTLLLPFGPQVVAKTLHVPVAEVEKLSIGDATVLFLTIINQNMDYIKNSFGLGLPGPLKRMMETLQVG